MARERQAAEAVTLYPVPGAWLPGVPAVAQRRDPETAAALIASGAFTGTPPTPEDRPSAAPAAPQED